MLGTLGTTPSIPGVGERTPRTPGNLLSGQAGPEQELHEPAFCQVFKRLLSRQGSGWLIAAADAAAVDNLKTMPEAGRGGEEASWEYAGRAEDPGAGCGSTGGTALQQRRGSSV